MSDNFNTGEKCRPGCRLADPSPAWKAVDGRETEQDVNFAVKMPRLPDAPVTPHVHCGGVLRFLPFSCSHWVGVFLPSKL